MHTILVIDDEAYIRQFVSSNLRVRGFEVVEAEDAEEGLEIIRAAPPDLVLLDIKLPGMDGWAFLDALGGDGALPNVPVIVITGSLLLEQAADQTYTRLMDVLIKPLSVQQLVHSVRQALQIDDEE